MQQSIKKGQILGYVGLRSKNGSLVEMQWVIPMNHQLHEYILYGHIFASLIEHQKLASEDIQKQLNYRFQINPLSTKQSK